MGYFDTLILTRPEWKKGHSLWKLKLNETEYIQLKEYVSSKLKFFPLVNNTIKNGLLSSFGKEAALLFSEYGRREWRSNIDSNNDSDSVISSIYRSLGFTDDSNVRKKALKEAAYNYGINALGIEVYHGVRNEKCFSLLFSGGIPLGRVLANTSSGSWKHLVSKLIDGDFADFDDVDLGVNSVVANHLRAVREFCYQLQKAIAEKNHEMMPFYCKDAENEWYVRLMKENFVIMHERKERNPFTFTWLFSIHDYYKTIKPYFEIKGPRTINNSFLEQFTDDASSIHELEFQVLADSMPVGPLCSYSRESLDKFFSFSDVHWKNSYVPDSTIVLSFTYSSSSVISKTLDLYKPILVKELDNGTYTLAKMQEIESEHVRVIIPKGWQLEGEPESLDKYKLGDDEFFLKDLDNCIDCQSLKFVGPNNESFTLSTAITSAELAIFSKPINNYYFSDANVFYFNDTFSVGRLKSRPISHDSLQFCADRRTEKWTDTLLYGKVFMRAQGQDTYVSPVRFVNLGDTPDDISINLKKVKSDSCKLKVCWAHGNVEIDDAVKDGEGFFSIEKVSHPKNIMLHFYPKQGNGKSFDLSLYAPYYEFSIVHSKTDKPLANGSLLSLNELSLYHYHFSHVKVKMKITYSTDIEHTFNYLDSNDRRIQAFGGNRITPDGSLLQLLGGLQYLQRMIYSEGTSAINSKIKVKFMWEGKALEFDIYEFPYKLKKDGDIIRVVNQSEEEVDYDGTLNAIPLEWNEDFRIMSLGREDESSGFSISSDVKAFDSVLLFGDETSRILPKWILPKQDEEPTKEQKDLNFQNYLKLKDSYSTATLTDKLWLDAVKWFKFAQNESISLENEFHLRAVCSSSSLLVRFIYSFLYHKMVDEDYDDDYELLISEFMLFEKKMGFQWFWICTKDMEFLKLQDFFDFEEIKANLPSCLLGIEDYENYKNLMNDRNNVELQDTLTMNFIYRFAEKCCMFLKELMVRSLKEFVFDTDFNETAESILFHVNLNSKHNLNMIKPELFDLKHSLDEKYELVFSGFASNYTIRNEITFYGRLNVLLSQMKGSFNLFGQDRAIRHSVIYVFSHYKKLFLEKLCETK